MMNKNTVKADNQLKKNEFVTFEGNGGLRVMFVGNSITRHGVKEDIGWFNDFGMAASCKENDYVHLLIKAIDERISASYCICQASQWEVNHKSPEKILDIYTPAREFGADIIIMRICENCYGDLDAEAFEKNYPEFVKYLNTKNGKVIFTTGFWKNDITDALIEKTANDMNAPCVYLGDLGDKPEMCAYGKFEHDGVQAHPGDLGMKHIAERIFAEIEKMI